MTSTAFVGRKRELERLKTLHKRGAPSLAVIKGRRRVGKSRLVHFYASTCVKSRLWDFAGLAPQTGVDAERQRDHFGRTLASQLGLPPFTFQDWTDALEHLSKHLKPGDIVLFDEISWMGTKDPLFIPKLKAWWDKQSLPFLLVLCGSVSTWIEENILKSTAFFGRVNLTIPLEPLPIPDASQLLRAAGFQGSDYDIYTLLSILGGIPWYLEQIGPGRSAEDWIKRLCFERGGLLVLEFDHLFHDLFNGKSASCKKILDSLREGMRTLAEVRRAIGFSHSGTLSRLMEHLITAGFVQKQPLWSFKTSQPLKQSLYRICDPYMRFYLKVIEPQRNKIDLGSFESKALSALPGFEVHLGLQVEQLLLQNRALLLQAIGICPTDLVADGPFRQSKTAKKAGCQIDYLVQTATKNLFVCAFKFRRRELGMGVIGEVQEKIAALKVPKGFATIPVLFHAGGVSSQLATDGYFYRIIDILDFIPPGGDFPEKRFHSKQPC